MDNYTESWTNGEGNLLKRQEFDLSKNSGKKLLRHTEIPHIMCNVRDTQSRLKATTIRMTTVHKALWMAL